MANAFINNIRGKFGVVALGLAWATAVSVGLAWVNRYQMTPGAAAAATTRWPGATAVALAPDRDTLIMFVHPQCPCSRASLGELANVMARRGDRVLAYVAFFNPGGEPQTWSQTDLWRDAQAIPGVKVLVDDDAALARRFGAATSGQVLLYDASGRLLFNGGITDSRGHFGDNAGEDAVVAMLKENAPPTTMPAVTPVYGCAIYTRQPLKMPAVVDSNSKVCPP